MGCELMLGNMFSLIRKTSKRFIKYDFNNNLNAFEVIIINKDVILSTRKVFLYATTCKYKAHCMFGALSRQSKIDYKLKLILSLELIINLE